MGMLPELILNEDEKKERFRKHFSKKKQQAKKNISEVKADVSAQTMKEEEEKSCIVLQNRPTVTNN